MARTDLIRLGFTVMDHYGSEPTIQGAGEPMPSQGVPVQGRFMQGRGYKATMEEDRLALSYFM